MEKFEQKEKELFSLFGVLGKFKEKLLEHLKDNFNLNYAQYRYDYFFTPKQKEYIVDKLSSLYDFLVNKEKGVKRETKWIDISEKDFLEVFPRR